MSTKVARTAVFLGGLLGAAACAQEADKPTLTSVTLQSGTNFIGEIRSENAVALVLFDLNTGEEKTLKVADVKSRASVNEATATARVGLPRYLAWRIKKELKGPAAGKIAEITPSAIYLTLGSKDGVEVGAVLSAFRDEGELKDPDTGAVIGMKRSKLAKLEVTEVQESYCKAKRLGDLEVELRAKDVVEQDGVNLAVAVLPMLDVSGDESTEGKVLAEQLATVLVSRGITIVERERLNVVLAELALQQSKSFDPAAAQRVGKQLGAAAVLTGAITPKGTKSEAHLRLIRVQSGEAVVAASQELATSGSTPAAVASMVGRPPAVGGKSTRGVFAQQLGFGTETDVRNSWRLVAPDHVWSIENGALKFTTPSGFPTASIDLRYQLHGDIAIEVVGRMNRASELTVHLFGEQVITKGPFRVQLSRQGQSLKINNNGIFSTRQIKESWGDSPTGLKLSWRVASTAGGDCWITGVAIRAAKADYEVD